MIRPQKALQLETLLGGLGVTPAAGGKHSPRTSSLSETPSHRRPELLGKFNGFPWPPPGLLGFILFFCFSESAMFDLSILALPDNAHPVGLDEAPW